MLFKGSPKGVLKILIILFYQVFSRFCRVPLGFYRSYHGCLRIPVQLQGVPASSGLELPVCGALGIPKVRSMGPFLWALLRDLKGYK